jgi:hypothetical protein
MRGSDALTEELHAEYDSPLGCAKARIKTAADADLGPYMRFTSRAFEPAGQEALDTRRLAEEGPKRRFAVNLRSDNDYPARAD